MFVPTADRVAIMGVLNVTPDSFSDGGEHFSIDAAISHGLRLFEQGADIVDVGGESSRPNAEPVSATDERRRVMPVIRALCESGKAVSVDTSKHEIAHEAVSLGAKMINDVTGFRDPQMVNVVAASDCSLCIMHMQGDPRTMQAHPHYQNVVLEVRGFLIEQATVLRSRGVAPERIWVDPGIGFGKNLNHNLQILRNLQELVTPGYQVLVGVSRKSFIGSITNEPVAKNRLPGSIAAAIYAAHCGARMLRVHDVEETKRALAVWQAIENIH